MSPTGPKISQEAIERLRGYVRSKVACLHDSEDIAQEVVAALHRRWNMGDLIEDAAAWLFAAARNKVVDWYRRKRGRPLSLDSESAGAETDAAPLWNLLDAGVATPEEEALRAELRTHLEEAIGRLPGDQRAVFLLHEIEGVSFREMAARTGVPVNTLLARKRYAVLKLRKELEQYLSSDVEV